jgi:DNA-binding transcriptional LysR family regulator
LEESLGVRLIERSTRQLRLTPNGERFLQYALQINELIESVNKDFQALKDEPQGILTLAVSPLIGELHVRKLLISYMKQYPQVQLEVLYTEDHLDPIKDGIDVIIWTGSLPKSNLIAKWFSNSWRMLFASPQYLQERGTPETIDDLLEHDCIQNDPQCFPHWELQNTSKTKKLSPSFRINTNNFWLAREAAIEGQGIALLPVMLLGEDIKKNRLVPVLPDWCNNQLSVYAIFPSRKLLAPQVRAFLDMLERNRSRDLVSSTIPSLDNPQIQQYLNNMSLSAPDLIFQFDFKFD